MSYKLPSFTIPADLIYDLGSKDVSISFKNQRAGDFYKHHGIEGILALWVMAGSNFLDYETEYELVCSWWLDSKNCFKDLIINYLNDYNFEDSVNILLYSIISRNENHSKNEYRIVENQDGTFDFSNIKINDLLEFIKIYFPHHPQLLDPTNPIFSKKSNYCNGYDDTDYSNTFIINNVQDGFKDSIASLFYLKLKGVQIEDSLFKDHPIIEQFKIAQMLDLSHEEFYSYVKKLNIDNLQSIDFDYSL